MTGPSVDPRAVMGWPEYLVKRMVAAGAMDPATGATRRARAVTCSGCRRPVMRGLDRDFGGLSADADPAPLSALGEALALLAHRPTYELRWLGGRYEIDRRDRYRIAGQPAGTNGIDILVGHDCSLSPGQNYPTIDSRVDDKHARPKVADKDLPHNAPF